MVIDYENIYIPAEYRYKYVLMLASVIDPIRTEKLNSKIMEEQIDLKQILETVPDHVKYLLVFSLNLSEHVRNHVEPMTLTELIKFIENFIGDEK